MYEPSGRPRPLQADDCETSAARLDFLGATRNAARVARARAEEVDDEKVFAADPRQLRQMESA